MISSDKVSLTIGWVLVGVSLILGIIFLAIGIWLAVRKPKDETSVSDSKKVPTGAIILIAIGTLFLGMTMAATILNLTYNKKISEFITKKGMMLQQEIQSKGRELAKQGLSSLGQGMTSGGQRLMQYGQS
jgi:uncharacterized iron-regulated membrane protein